MNKLISKSLETGEVHLLFGFPKELMKEREKVWVGWIQDYTVRYTTPPTTERFEDEFDTFIPADSTDPLLDVYEQELTRKRNLYSREYLMSIQDKLKEGEDPLPYISHLYNQIRAGGGDITRFSTFDRSAYMRVPESIPYGISVLDDNTGGAAKGDLIYMVGRLGQGKTSITLWKMSAWILEGYKLLIISNENRAQDIMAKVDAYIGGFNPLKKRTMAWSQEDKNKLNTVSYIARNGPGDLFVPNRPIQRTDELTGLIHSYKPDLVVVDGIYLMSSGKNETNWEKVTAVSRDLKQIAQAEQVPILGIHQASRQAIGKGHIGIEDIAYSDALAQDADLLLTIKQEEEGRFFIECIKNRWGFKDGWGFFAHLDFASMTVNVLENARAEEGVVEDD